MWHKEWGVGRGSGGGIDEAFHNKKHTNTSFILSVIGLHCLSVRLSLTYQKNHEIEMNIPCCNQKLKYENWHPNFNFHVP